MTELLRDKELKFPHIMLVEASAGSGKTYLLSLRFVQFLLSDIISHNRLDNILAVTFTNNAAYEMKTRILLWLKKIALSQLSEEEENTLKSIVSSSRNIQEKATHLIEEILDNYHAFSVSTIDSFMVKLARASAIELGLSPELDILMSKNELIDEAVYIYISKLNRKEIENLLDIEREYNKQKIDFHLVETLKKLVNEIMLAEEYTSMPSVDGLKKLPEIEKEIKELMNELENLYESARAQYPKLKKYDFDKILNAYKNYDIQKLSLNNKNTSRDIDSKITEKLAQLAEKLKIKKALIHMIIARKIKEIVERRLHTFGKIHIGEITEKLHAFLREENIPGIYFSLGNRLYHFMIDEFQDTNPVQWDNLKVLIHEGLSKGGSLFIVGDIKQAIYGFRGSDYRVMKQLVDDFKQHKSFEFPEVPHDNIYLVNLENNYRSKSQIVEYVDSVFKEELLQKVNETGDPSGFLTYRQKAIEKNRNSGYIKTIHALEDEQKKIVMEIIKDVIARNYKYGDIAILTESNEKVIEISGWLTEEGIPVVSESGTDIRRRRVIKEIEFFLKFLDSPIDDFAFALFLNGCIAKKVMGDNTEILKSHSQKKDAPPLYTYFKDHNPLWWSRFIEPLFKEVGYLSTYDILLRILEKFRILENFPEETQAVLKLLDIALYLEEKGKGSLKHLIEALENENDSELFKMDTSSAKGGVHVMTIHKAKGLEFNVVINLITKQIRFNADSPLPHVTEEGVVFMKITKDDSGTSTILNRTYGREKLRYTVEGLNRQYVAMTRAKEELYNIVKIGSKEQPVLNIEEREKGIKSQKEIQKESSSCVEFINVLDLSFNIPDNEEEFILTSKQIEETKRGDFYHAVMSEIITISDLKNLNAVINKYRILFDFEEYGIEEKIKNAVNHPVISEYFMPREKRDIKTEIAFIDEEGRILRMDRVIIDPDKITVIDYKTGYSENTEKYEKQIKEYMKILKSIFIGRKIKGIVFNMDTGEYNEYEI